MIISGVVTLGRDVELKYAASGSAVVQINGAYNIGYGENKRTQWASIALFGKQAESLSPYLLKGTKVDVTARDVEVDIWDKKDGTQGVTLKGIAINIDLIGGQQTVQNGGNQQQYQQPQYQHQQGAPRQAPAYQPNDFDSEDSVPF